MEEPFMEKDQNKLKALESAIAQIEKQYGQGAIMKLGDTTKMQVEAVPTGSLSLDLALGVGGIPKGRIIEVYGPESSGKTTVALHMVAEVQKRGGIAGFIDAEHALDPVYARNIGVDIDELYISQPDSGEQAMEITETMVRSGAVDIVIVDSVAALVPKAEIDGDMGDSHVGLQARLMSQALRKLTAVINKSNCTVIFINQLREKIGVMFGNPETTTGGRALKFYASVRLDVRRIETLSQGGEKCMKATGIVRRIDDLGRVVIPKEIRRTLRIKEGTPLEIFTDREGEIILKKYSPIGELNIFAKEYAEALAQSSGMVACITDHDQVVAAAGQGSREYMGKPISKALEETISERGSVFANGNDRNRIPVTQEQREPLYSQIMQPIISAGDAVGSVLLLGKNERDVMGESEKMLIRTASGFLGRQMEQ